MNTNWLKTACNYKGYVLGNEILEDVIYRMSSSFGTNLICSIEDSIDFVL